MRTNELLEDEYDDDRDRSHYSSKDDRGDDERDRGRGDRERRRRYDDEGSEYDDLDRERERPKELEPAR
jgi:hypothetical protein